MPEELERDLGLPSVVAISMGAMIGSGIFILPGIAMGEAGPSVIFAFVLAAILVVPAAVSIAELGTAMPEAGGDYVFIERGMGPGAGTIAGLGTWLMLMFKGALALFGGMFYLEPVLSNFDITMTQGELRVLAVVIGALLIGVNVVGVKQTGGLQKILVLIMLFILGGFVALTGGSVEPAQYGGSLDGFFAEGATGLFAATATVLISYGGVTKVAAVAEEIENPGRNLPLGLLLSLVITAALYALIVAIVVGVVEEELLLTDEWQNIPVVAVVDVVGLGFLMVVAIVIAAMFALISTANAGILTASRYPFALSRDNLLPDTFATVSSRFRTPTTAILTTGGAMLFIIAVLPVEDIAKTAGAFQIVVYILVCLSIMAFRRRDPQWYDPEFESPLYPWIQLFGVVSGLFILTQMDLLPQVGGVGIALLGGLWYYVYGRPRVDRSGVMGEAIVDMVEPTLEEGEEKPHRIVVPVANADREEGLLRFAAAKAAKKEPAELIVMNVITVPEQTSLEQEVAYEKERIQRQQKLLDEAEKFAEEHGIGLRTHAIVGRDVGETVLDVIELEEADGVVMGWSGVRKRRDRILGSNIDQIIERAPCEVSLVRQHTDAFGDVVAFIEDGQYSPVVAEQAAAFAGADGGTSLTLVNVQNPDEGGEVSELEARGEAVIEDVATQVGVEEYNCEVFVSDDVQSTLVDIANHYDTSVLGVSNPGSVEGVLSGNISDTIGHEVDGTVVVVRDREGTIRSLRTAITRRFRPRRGVQS